MKKISKKVLVFFISIMLLVIIGNNYNLHAKDDESNEFNFWDKASNWYSNASKDGVILLDKSVMDQVADLLRVAGTTVIAIVSVVLGTKYMMSGATGKSEVKQQLVGFLIACLFFFGWSNLSSLLIVNTTYDSNTGVYTNVSSATQLFVFSGVDSYEDVFAKIFAIVVFVAQIIAVISIVVIGAKYILSGANGKAELKEKGPMFIMGILLIFSTLNVLSFISDAINQALKI